MIGEVNIVCNCMAEAAAKALGATRRLNAKIDDRCAALGLLGVRLTLPEICIDSGVKTLAGRVSSQSCSEIEKILLRSSCMKVSKVVGKQIDRDPSPIVSRAFNL